jgi:hypothetical protein
MFWVHLGDSVEFSTKQGKIIVLDRHHSPEVEMLWNSGSPLVLLPELAQIIVLPTSLKFLIHCSEKLKKTQTIDFMSVTSGRDISNSGPRVRKSQETKGIK